MSIVDNVLNLNPNQAFGAFIPDDSYIGDNFGSSVAISADGSILAVGAPNRDIPSPPSGTHTNDGVVYIYEWDNSSSSWTQRGDVLQINNKQYTDFCYFGSSVALSSDGSVLVVGSNGYYDDNHSSIGT